MKKSFITAVSILALTAFSPSLVMAGGIVGTIPEPSVLGLLAAGVVAAIFVARGKNK